MDEIEGEYEVAEPRRFNALQEAKVYLGYNRKDVLPESILVRVIIDRFGAPFQTWMDSATLQYNSQEGIVWTTIPELHGRFVLVGTADDREGFSRMFSFMYEDGGARLEIGMDTVF
ncbi:hypothetical protein KC906_04810 [Candidatus Kaiserbacteria bacterium]|nr:hypothetical protein [Candidatus Kaiserbacteria bacterium]